MNAAILFLSVVMLAACSTAPFVVTPAAEKSPLKSETIFVTQHGNASGNEHTGIILAAKDLEADSPFLSERFDKPKYYEVGWGEKDYYQAKRKTPDLEFKALYWPTKTAIHIVALRKEPSEHFPAAEIIELQLSDSEYDSLRKYISSTFFRDQDQQAIPLKSGLYGDDQFYLANGEYSVFNTCNVWTAKALKSAGFDINPSNKLTAASVMGYLRNP
ncbi:MAG: TIGR02117 family protein [Arenicellales bacterium]